MTQEKALEKLKRHQNSNRRNTSIESAEFTDIDFAHMCYITFYKCSFYECTACFSQCKFIECDFYGCNIKFVNNEVYHSIITGGSLETGIYNEYYHCIFGKVTFAITNDIVDEVTSTTKNIFGKDRFYNSKISNPNGEIESIPWANVCPEFGEFYAYKALSEGKIAKLLIPADAKRTCNFEKDRKCRAEYAKVIEITNIEGTEKFDSGVSTISNNFVYKVGEEVHPDMFDEDRFTTCTNGIHFFMSRREAIDYYY